MNNDQADATPTLASVPETDDGIRALVDAALFASTDPLTLGQLHALFDPGQGVSFDSISQALDALSIANKDRGIELVRSERGFRYRTKPGLGPRLSRLWDGKPRKLSRAMMETLALIAYRQPITRSEIEEVRGVSVASTIIRNLLDFAWVKVAGHRDMPGRPALLVTTEQFLESFGLQALEDLPPLSEIKSLAELEPELDFDDDSDADGAVTMSGSQPDMTAATADAPDEPLTGVTDLDEVDRINAQVESGWGHAPSGGNDEHGYRASDRSASDNVAAPGVQAYPQEEGGSLTEAEQLAIIEHKLKQQQTQLSDAEAETRSAANANEGNSQNDDGNQKLD